MKKFYIKFLSINALSIFGLVKANDCYLLNKFLNRGGSIECCDGINIKCDSSGSIISLELNDYHVLSNITETLDFSHFPVFNNLIELNIGTSKIYPPNELPSRFFEQPKLNTLTVYSSSISIIPINSIKKSPISEINLEHNELNEFPYQFKELPNLQHLYLWDNNISGVVDLSGFDSLNQLDVGKNRVTDVINIPKQMQMLFLYENSGITKVPSDIAKLNDLTHLNLNQTSITELPPDLFKLRLNYFKIGGNSQLSTKIINFGNKNIRECEFQGTNILCYQEGTCASLDVNDLTPCTEDEIEKIIKAQTKEGGLSKPLIIGIIAGILIIGLIGFIIIRRNKNKNKKSYDDEFKEEDGQQYDIVVKERIKKIKIEDDFKDEINNSKKDILSDPSTNKKSSLINSIESLNNNDNNNNLQNENSRMSIRKNHYSKIFSAKVADESNDDIDINNSNNSDNHQSSADYNPNPINRNFTLSAAPAYSEIDNINEASGSNNRIDESFERLPSYSSLQHSTIKFDDSKRPLY